MPNSESVMKGKPSPIKRRIAEARRDVQGFVARGQRKPNRADESSLREKPIVAPSGVFRLERRTTAENDSGKSRYQALRAEKSKIGGKAGLLIDVINIRDEARYYLTLEEATQLATWLTERSSTRKQAKRSGKQKAPAKG